MTLTEARRLEIAKEVAGTFDDDFNQKIMDDLMEYDEIDDDSDEDLESLIKTMAMVYKVLAGDYADDDDA